MFILLQGWVMTRMSLEKPRNRSAGRERRVSLATRSRKRALAAPADGERETDKRKSTVATAGRDENVGLNGNRRPPVFSRAL